LEELVVKVQMVIKTTGLQYDDRLRKEALSLLRSGSDARIVVLENANIPRQTVAYSAVPAESIALTTRHMFPRGRALVFKTIEMNVRFLARIIRERPDVVWVHDFAPAGLIPVLAMIRKLGVLRRVVWDQHELPSERFLTWTAARILLTAVMNLCDYVVVANSWRREFLLASLGGRCRASIAVLENFPDDIFVQLPEGELPQSVSKWLNGKPFVFSQGGAGPGRNFHRLVAAIMMVPNLKLVVAGPHNEKEVKRLQAQYGKSLEEKVYFAGFVPQLQMTPFIDDAVASVVFYERTNSNNLLCASNKLYQAVARGVPVLVGLNPPMKELVDQYQCGIVVDDDDPSEIAAALVELLSKREELAGNARRVGHRFLWHQQDSTIRAVAEGNPGALSLPV